MSWIEELYNTYENCSGIGPNNNTPTSDTSCSSLTPLYHTLNNTHIEIRLNGNGDFIDAKLEQLKNTIIPCTEKSANARANNPPPHPLCDKIQFCAKDYNGSKPSYYHKYIELLGGWANSESKHPMVEAIYKYVKKGTLISDLKNTHNQIINDDEDPGGLFIRWKVESPGINEICCWKSDSLSENWIKFYGSQDIKEEICFVIGKKTGIATNHPMRVRNSGDKAKLISSNDTDGFTFLGRFCNANQSVSIGSEVSQKAHSALRWLIERQSFRNGDQVIVSWAVSGQETPDLLADSLSLFDETDEEKIIEVTKISYHDAGQTFARKLSQKIAGYKAELKNASKIVVMGLDSAGPGRLSISFYRELSNSEFLERIESWHSQMAWFFLEFFQDASDKKKKHSGYMVIAPAPRIIAEACYGIRLDDKLKKSTIERLLPCIVDRRQIPIDLVDFAVKRASNKIGMEHWEWERTLSVACALYRCYSIRNSNNSIKNQYTMALENGRTDRDYLYGRLLAVAEHIEERALFLSKENRETNAARMMHMFSEHPFKTWEKLWAALSIGYFPRLQSKRPNFLFKMKNLVGEINSLFIHSDFENDNRLTGLYLLGYHCQRLELVQKNEKEEKETELENN